MANTCTIPYGSAVVAEAEHLRRAMEKAMAAAATPVIKRRKGAKPSSRSKRVTARALEEYREHLMSLPEESFSPLEGAWLSDYKIEGAVPWVDAETCPKPEIAVLIEVAISKGANPAGAVSHKQRKGSYLTKVSGPRIYVGRTNGFLKVEATEWSMLQ